MNAYGSFQCSGQINTTNVVDGKIWYTPHRPDALKTGAARIKDRVESRGLSVRDEGECCRAATDHVLRAADLADCKRVGSDDGNGGGNGNDEGGGVHLGSLGI